MIFAIMDLADTPEKKRKIEMLYEAYHQLIYAVSYKILKNKEDAEDAELQTWEKIIKNLDKISEIEGHKTKGFIVIISERTAIDLYRGNKRRQGKELPIMEYEASPFWATQDIQIENMELRQVIGKLPKKYSEVLLLHYVYAMSAKEIAKLLQVKEAAVLQRLHRARKALGKELGIDEK